MASTQSNRPRLGNDRWSLFLRQRRLTDQLRRLRNDFKHCYCPPGCRGEPQNHVVLAPGDLPAEPLHGPHVPVASDMPDTRARPESLRDPGSTIVAEARGTSDIRLHRTGTRATLRMSMQVRTDSSTAGRFAYFGEMFLTRPGQPEVFIGFIQSWHMNRQRLPDDDSWEDIYMNEYGARHEDRSDMQSHREYFQHLFGVNPGIRENDERDQNGNLLPEQDYRGYETAWARVSDDTDIVYIPLIWLDEDFTGERIIDQGFELFFRLMTGGSLPEPYNITRPLSVLLQAGELGPPYGPDWRTNTGARMEWLQRLTTIARAYERNGFMRLMPYNDADYFMGRRVDPGDHPAAPGDTAILPPNPPYTDLSTPSPARRRGKYPPKWWVPPAGWRDDDDSDDDHDHDGDDDDGVPRRGRSPPGAPVTGMGRGKPMMRLPPRTPRGSRLRDLSPSGRPRKGGLSPFGPERRLF